ncbi:bifunctional phosphoserine phosphatase/homoserine phosphotransferase ThrH [Desulfosarcina sp.]|uniref:bifunctional phosphoserine phosphatase/homoserine phosphotransferase ThrH n=1 Tax=Desulfosarcina sp. TaxID=2027861 RepID=UPI0029AFEDDC|nr:bifunctional phosphoserine phosphatase/homoserine phosphotransferase ThrH [Desulfosarcina sp.]MDX2451502.1 bifunctional phosphoserine phosphatase/homoserine phosphotransferase ThrH [Desulfosarcina sp.]MDX2489316.1 bifunctional phosphoserine phosphatase/homoserine phosphotransferase ThrH [Desulfosarcina sp.]
MHVICSDLEGVFVPEIWINVAERTGIDELRLTTRDISDYDVLMKWRLSILDANGLKLKDITDVIATMEPLPGARQFLDWLRARTQVIVVSDTFVEFARPLMEKLGWPTLLCHGLTIDGSGAIAGYNLRQTDGKRKVVQAFKSLNFQVLAMGDSYNDVNMLKEAHQGVLFCPPQNVIDEFPQFPVTTTYDDLMKIFGKILTGD